MDLKKAYTQIKNDRDIIESFLIIVFSLIVRKKTHTSKFHEDLDKHCHSVPK